MDKGNVLDVVTSIFFVGVSVSQIETILGIVMLCIQIVYIFVRLGINIYTKIKNNKLEEIDDEIKETIEDLEEIKDSLSKVEEEEKNE